MRLVVSIAALAAGALPVHAAAPAGSAELSQLEQRLLPLVTTLSPRTSGDIVLKALKPGRSEVYDECDEGCFVNLNFDGGKAAPYFGVFFRQATKLDSKTYYAGKPFTADTWKVSLTIDPQAARDLCFSVPAWNAALAKEGWPPLKSTASTYPVRVSDDPKVRDSNNSAGADERIVQGNMYQSHKGVQNITLFAAPEGLRDRVSSNQEIDAIAAMGDCMRMVTAGNE